MHNVTSEHSRGGDCMLQQLSDLAVDDGAEQCKRLQVKRVTV